MRRGLNSATVGKCASRSEKSETNIVSTDIPSVKKRFREKSRKYVEKKLPEEKIKAYRSHKKRRKSQGVNREER